MPTETYIVIPKNNVQEKSSFTATVYFRNGDASTTPTTARYRIDCSTTGEAIRAWTDLTPATSIAISITPDDNKIVSQREERRQITVETNTDLDSQTRERVYWIVKSIEEF